MESEQIQKTKKVIDERRQKLQHIKSRLQKKLNNKNSRAELEQKPTNSKTLINHLNINSNLFQDNQSSQFYHEKDVNKSPSVDKTFQFNSTLFKHLDKNQSENKSKFQNASSQFYRDNADNYSQKGGSPRKDKYFQKQPQHDSSLAESNPLNSNLFSEYDKFLQQINTKAKLPVTQIKRHLQKKQDHLQLSQSKINAKGMSSTHKGFGLDNIHDNASSTSLNFDQINNLISTTRNIMNNNNQKPRENNRAYMKQRQKKISKQTELPKKQKQYNHLQSDIKKRIIEDKFGQSTFSVKMHKKDESDEFSKRVLPPHPDRSARTQLTSGRKEAYTQRQFAHNSTQSVDFHKEKLKLMLSQKKKNQLSCDKLDIDDSIEYDLSQDDQEDTSNKKRVKQDQKNKRVQKLLLEKQNLRKQLRQIDDELASLQTQS